MIKNNFLLAWRNLIRNKLHSAVNILGLAIGISACLVISLIVRHELSFDNFHTDKDRIYRVYSAFSGDFTSINRGVPTALASTVKSEFTGVESSAAFQIWYASITRIDEKNEKKEVGREDPLILAGPEFFTVFDSYQWLAGNPETSLSKPFQVVLTEKAAKKYFATDNALNAMGKELHFRDSLIVTVSGIVKDFTENSDLAFQNFISFSTIENSWLKSNFRLNDWGSTNSGSQFFIKLEPGKTPSDLEGGLKKLAVAYKEHHKDNNWQANYHLQPFSDLHFNTKIGIFDNGGGSAANLQTLRMLVLVAILLLAIAAINFINLETALSLRRAKEVGVRKVMGSTRGKLMVHFLTRSLLLTLLAVLVALPLSALALWSFKEFIPAAVALKFTDPFVIIFLALSVLIVGTLAGFYPAFSMSSFLPALALKNQISANSHQSRTGFIRKSLIVFQFTFAQILIIATLIVGYQIHFMLNKDLGFSKEAILYFDTPWNMPHEKTVTLKNEIEHLAGVGAVTLCSDAPASNSWSSNTWKYNNGKEEVHHNVYRKFGDTAFLSVFNLHLIAGRNIHRSDSADEYIINETYMKLLGFKNPEEALGKLLISDNHRFPIVGVVKDFNFRPLNVAIEPAIIADEEFRFGTIAIKFNTATGGDGIKTLTEQIKKSFIKIYPDEEFDYSFLDDTVAKFYQTEQRTAKLVNTATGIAVVISCLGLFALATFTTTQRTKEIGIRKVLGASVNNLVIMLSREFVVLVVFAFVIAAPVSWYFASDWLTKYAYRTPIGLSLFVWTIVASVGIVILSVSYQAFKAAGADPVKSLRYE